MEKLITLIKKLQPDLQIGETTALIKEGILDSLSIFLLVSALSDEYDVDISPAEITPDQFATPRDIYSLIQRLKNEDA